MLLMAPVIRAKKGHHREVLEELQGQGVVRMNIFVVFFGTFIEILFGQWCFAIGFLFSPFKLEANDLLTMYMTRGTEMSNRVKQSQTILGEMAVKQSETLLAVDEGRPDPDPLPFEELICSGDWYSSHYVGRDDILSCAMHLHQLTALSHFNK